MANRTISMSDQLYDYLLLSSLREPEILRRLRDETAPYPHSMMQTAPEQGQFMALLLQIIGAVNTIELGVYTGLQLSLDRSDSAYARQNHSVRHK